MLFLWIVSLAALLAVVWPAIRRFKQRYDLAKNLSGPSIFELIAATRKGRLLEFMGECREKYGPVFRIWIAFHLNIFFTDPDDVQTICKSNVLIDKAKSYSFLEAWLGKGLLTNSGEDWHLKRKLLTPGFHFQILSSFKKPMDECGDILIDRLAKVADGQPVNIYKYITLYTLDVICETAMGIKVNAQVNDESDFAKKTQLTCQLVQSRIFSAWKRIGFLYNWSADKKALDEALGVLHGLTKRVIKERRQNLDTQLAMDDSDVGTKQRRPFLDSILIAQRDTGLLSDANIQEEVDTFMFGGHDTTSSSIAFTVYLLSKHPEVQRKVLEEVLEIGDALQPMPYLEAVLKESLRLYPPVPSIARQTKQPFSVDNLTYPTGVTLTVNLYLLHRDRDHFEDPEAFRPERFEKDAAPIHPFVHAPFSAGARNCIGKKFAMLELKCSVGRLVREFEFSAVAGFELNLAHALVLKSRNGVMVQLRKRSE